MATISNATLEINLGLPQAAARVTVKCKVRFSQLEQFLMKNGQRYRLDCNVWGEDFGQGNWLNADDFLFAYSSVFYPDSSPAAIEEVTFERTLRQNTLDEDLGTDEIYGQLILTNMEDGSKTKAKTNVIKHKF